VAAAFRNVLRFTGVIILLAACACSAPPADARGTFAAEALPRVDVTIHLQADHRSDGDRALYAAFTTLRILGTWLAPFPDSTLSVTPNQTPWWTAPPSMAPEYAVARAVGRKYWMRVVDTRGLPPWFVDGLAEYAARRAVSKIVDERYLAVYRSRAEGRYFGGFVPHDLRVGLRVEDEGDPIGTDAPEARMLLTLGTLERWTSRPVFDAILLEFVQASAGTQPAVDDFARVASRVSGQDLSWLFDEALNRTGTFDYAIEKFDSQAEADGRFRTTVAVRRAGDGVFRRALQVETTFAGGDSIRDFWDGRSQTQTFEYRSPTRAVSAEVDPDGVLLLDRNRRNNGIALETEAARTAASRWSARWMIWLEDALLTYVALT
jgi:hypothetical protein